MSAKNDNCYQELRKSTNQPGSKFDLKPNDLKFFATKKELEAYVKKNHPDRKIVWG